MVIFQLLSNDKARLLRCSRASVSPGEFVKTDPWAPPCLSGGLRGPCVCAKSFWLCLFVTPWTVARQAPLTRGFSMQEYRSGLPGPPPGDLPDPGIESVSPALAGGLFITSATWEANGRF